MDREEKNVNKAGRRRGKRAIGGGFWFINETQ